MKRRRGPKKKLNSVKLRQKPKEKKRRGKRS